MNSHLAPYVKAKVIADSDVAAVQTLMGLVGNAKALTDPKEPPEFLATLLLCLAIRTPRDGHTCIDLDHISDWLTAEGLKAQLEWPSDSATWLSATKTFPSLFGDPGSPAPVIVDGHCVYLNRAHAEESAIAAALTRNHAQHIHIVLGGPGTGKTREVAMKFIDRFRSSNGEIRIALAAPTGKAAARMREVLKHQISEIKKFPEGKDVDWDAVDIAVDTAFYGTVPLLLGFNPSRDVRYKFNATNYLPYDWVVVDEVSMLSSSMMYRLTEALDPATSLLIVGDPDQLASVDAGSVLGDIANVAKQRDSILFPQTKVMTVQYRLPKEIDDLARLLRLEAPVEGQVLGNEQHVDAVIEYLRLNNTLISWLDPDKDKEQFSNVRDRIVQHAQELHAIAISGDAQGSLDKREQLQLLCAHREGKTGVSYWNDFINHQLGPYTDTRWYPGRPIMVTRNNRSIDLYNGDVGIIVPDADGQPVGAFSDGITFRLVPTLRLEDVETVHALTIHKSQGSQYDEVIVVLPNESSRILTRELFYTGISRAEKKLTIIGSEKVLRSAVSQAVRRTSGLATRL